MNGMLASVRDWEEAQIALNAHVDIIDLKQPNFGALGALDIDTIRDIVTKIDFRCPVSATIGDLPMQADIIFDAVQTTAKTGVDFVKIGFFPNGDWLSVVEKLRPLTTKYQLIAVLFADKNCDIHFISALKQNGFSGVMLDTMDKQHGSLTHVMPLDTIQTFVALAKKYSLICGLAGSLRAEDIAVLLPLEANYLGFRGALCADHNRIQTIDTHALQTIRQLLRVS
ncbi:MAG: (5-formylfuran-3-yl)methyl phosphate synthase [Methylococcales bacterium]|nr:(5-formylfuran-3-yl)methyl phosphate synthase [Methylococcales bacterium]